jgi:predicted MPP superfamily phosphohydrolase
MLLMVSAILGIFLVLIPHLLWLLLFVAGRLFKLNISYSPFGWSALALMLICWIIIAYGYYIGRWRVDVNRVEYINRDIPRVFDGYRVVHISDLHLNTYNDKPEVLSKIVDKINSLNPDLVCFTGDLVNTSYKEALPYIETLKRLQSRDGVVSVLGNHDFMIYSFAGSPQQDRERAVDSLVSLQRDMLGWNLLRNSNIRIERGDDYITVLGVDNINIQGKGFRTINEGDLSRANDGCDGFKILLSHDPSHWGAEVVVKTDIQLTLSGHTHASQFRLFGLNPAMLMFDQTDGRYDKDNQTLYVNIGLGCTVPFRIGANSEITLLEFKFKD